MVRGRHGSSSPPADPPRSIPSAAGPGLLRLVSALRRRRLHPRPLRNSSSSLHPALTLTPGAGRGEHHRFFEPELAAPRVVPVLVVPCSPALPIQAGTEDGPISAGEVPPILEVPGCALTPDSSKRLHIHAVPSSSMPARPFLYTPPGDPHAPQ